ncbi:MAG: hypothetical protein HOO99_04760 [Hyphomicrobiaceae bacterium]|nr:hypothetical protein [Hyphomicrobiaceae bacterium]
MSTERYECCFTILRIFQIGVAVGATLVSWSVVAAPLDGETCQRLNVQRQGLEARGVRQMVAVTPQQAKGQLSADQIANVRLLMEVDGQLRFRCPMDGSIAALKDDPPEEQTDGSPDPALPSGAKSAPLKSKQPTKAGAAIPVKVPSRTAKSEVADPTESKNTAAAIPDGGNAKPQRAPATVKKATSKANDAFRAPASGDPNVMPLDKQVPSDPQVR